MTKTLIALFCSTALLAQTPSASRRIQVFPGRPGLVLIAAASDGFSVAADAAQLNADGTISQADKLFPIGKEGVVAIAGAVSTQDPVNRPVREEFDVAAMVRAWVDSHPGASLDSGIREISTLVSNNANRFFAARVSGGDAGRLKFALVFAGYSGDKPVLTGERFFMPLKRGEPMRVEPIIVKINPGKVFVFGTSAVAQELLSGTAPTLKSFKLDPAVKVYRSSRPEQLTAQDLGALLRVVLQATESAEGKKLSGAIAVAPPNKFGEIKPGQGFAGSIK